MPASRPKRLTIENALTAVAVAGLAVLFCLMAAEALAHDHKRPELDAWYASLKVPNDTAVLRKGASCCDRTDCKQRIVQSLAPGLYLTKGDDGRPVYFTDAARIDEPAVRDSNPYFQAVVCIYQGVVVCYVPGQVGG